jgi:hypothetical protein
MNMNRILATAAFAFLAASTAAHAAYYDPDGEWMDTRRHLALNSMPANSEAIAHLNYAKITCRTKTGTTGGRPPTPGYIPCMKAQGYVFVYATPAQVAARKKATERVQPQVVIVPAPPAIDFMPHGCNGFIGGGGGLDLPWESGELF